MKSIIQTVLLTALVTGVTSLQAADSAEAILKKHVDAIGGEAAFKKVKSREMVAVLDIPAQGMTAEMKIISKAPNKLRTEIEIPGMGKVVEGFDGKVGWSQNPFVGLMEKEGDQLDQAKRQADFYRDVEIFNRYESWTVKGNEKVGDQQAVVLVGKSADGSEETIYIDTTSNLLLKVTAETDSPNGKMVASTLLMDYKDVDGLKLPHTIKIESAMGSMSLKVKSIKNDVPAPDSLFSKPAN